VSVIVSMSCEADVDDWSARSKSSMYRDDCAIWRFASSSGASGSLCPAIIVRGSSAATASMVDSQVARLAGVEFRQRPAV
jgi:hypothetical protein